MIVATQLGDDVHPPTGFEEQKATGPALMVAGTIRRREYDDLLRK
jgi:hypothetical protein